MANTPVVVLDDTLTDIANAIRGKNGSSDTYRPGQMADAIDNIPAGTSGIPREVSQTGVYGFPEQNFTFSLPSNATDAGENALYYAFQSCSRLTSVDLSSLTTVSGRYAFGSAFQSCSSLTSADLRLLATVSGTFAFNSVFQSCPSLTSVSFPALTTVDGDNAFSSAFKSCPNLTSVSFPALTTVSGSNAFSSAFRSCTNLTSVSFPVLATVSGPFAFDSAFRSCTSLTSVSFPALTTSSFGASTNQFNNMLSGVRGCTVHFPAAIQSTIGNWTSVQNGFGGTNTTVLFDL